VSQVVAFHLLVESKNPQTLTNESVPNGGPGCALALAVAGSAHLVRSPQGEVSRLVCARKGPLGAAWWATGAKTSYSLRRVGERILQVHR
jgi:hypothetical protein